MIERPLSRLFACLVLAAAGSPSEGAAVPCFDFDKDIREPLRPPIAPRSDGTDAHAFGRYEDGASWAAGRAQLAMPIATAYTRLLDHRNVKDMTKTTLVTTVVEKPFFLAFHLVDVAVKVRAFLFKMTLRWREAWAFSVVEGTADAPQRIVVSYEKVAGTHHIERQCGSYVLAAAGASATDLSLYEEIKAAHRDAEDTVAMHRGILKNLRNAAP